MAGETILTIVGNLTADPELRTTGTGTQVCGFTIASTPRVWNRQANQYEDGQSLFMRCSAWRDLAGHCAQSLSKGMRVVATGRLSQRSYQAQDGTNRTVVEMTVDEIGPSLRYATAQVTKLTALDAGGQALLGALVGMAGYFALIPAIMLLDFQNQHFTFEQLWVGLPALAAVTVGVTLLALVSALVALRRVAITPLGVTQRTGQPMPSAWRALIFLAVLAVGYLLLNSISAFAHLGQMVVYAIIFGVFFLGFAMVNVVGTWVVAMRARSRAKHPKDAATMIAMRRILDNPKRAWRNVSGVALAVFIAGMTSVCGLLATGIGGNHDPFDPSMLYMRDIAMGGFLTLAFAAVLAAVSSGVMQTGNVYDQADEYRMLALEGTDEATLDKARMMEVITPLNTVMAVSLGCSVLLLFPILATSLLNPASLLTLAAGIGLCYALMVLGGCAANHAAHGLGYAGYRMDD